MVISLSVGIFTINSSLDDSNEISSVKNRSFVMMISNSIVCPSEIDNVFSNWLPLLSSTTIVGNSLNVAITDSLLIGLPLRSV